MRLITHHVTSAGGRRNNEDALMQASGPAFTVLAVADGLGGHGGGAFAARQCVETIVSGFSQNPGLSDARLQALVGEADLAVAALRHERRKSASSMRTTVALLAVWQDDARWVHVGDSRVYWFRHNVLVDRTRDHTVAELVTDLADSSLAAPSDASDRNRLLRVVGAGKGCNADLGRTTVRLQVGDAFLLCTDGVWSVLSDPEITACLGAAATPHEWCIALEQRLEVSLGYSPAEDQDNYSMICGMVLS